MGGSVGVAGHIRASVEANVLNRGFGFQLAQRRGQAHFKGWLRKVRQIFAMLHLGLTELGRSAITYGVCDRCILSTATTEHKYATKEPNTTAYVAG